MADKPFLYTEKLTIGYNTDLIKDICINAVPGKVLTLIGPNGSGKSTLLKTLTGQLADRGGCVYLDGRDISGMKGNDIARRMSMVMTAGVNPELMTCREMAGTGRYPYTGRLGILSPEDERKVSEALKLTGTENVADRLFNRVSDGYKQRIMLARAICQEPRVLILDEPASYLDIRYKLELLTQIRRLADEEGIAIIMSLHELDLAMKVSDTVAALGDGTLQRIGAPEEVFTEEFIRSLFGLEGVDVTWLGSMPWFAPDKAPEHKQTRTGKRHPAVIMIQGTMSGAGKTLIAAGLCRIFARRGYSVAPFKSQNMALNSYVTRDGLEMGRAQVMQAECCNREPDVCMNPILLKPTDDSGSQVIVHGVPIGNMRAAEYFRYKKKLIPEIMKAYDKLCETADVIVVEGAGSPVEINLKSVDIVNMGLAGMIDAPVLLVGDIDRGGVFAQLKGTLDLMTPEERGRVRGLIVNKFRGDAGLFADGVRILEEICACPVEGVVPYMHISLEDEDSQTERFGRKKAGDFDIAVIRLPHISNFTDFDTFEQSEEISVRYIDAPADLDGCDMIVVPGTKNTLADLRWLRQRGFDTAVKTAAEKGCVIFGVCGGYQMLGCSVIDPDCAEGGGEEEGLGLLEVQTVIREEKVRSIYKGTISEPTGLLSGMGGVSVTGYEIHMGETGPLDGAKVREFTSAGTGYCRDNIYGTYIHGIFDEKAVSRGIIERIAESRGKSVDTGKIRSFAEFKESQYEALADALEKCLDIEHIMAEMGL